MVHKTNEAQLSKKYSLLPALFLLCCLQAIHFAILYDRIIDHELVAADGYWHLLRVEKLSEDGNWYESSLLRSNAPYGEHLHWTRPFDMLLYFGALIGSPFWGFKEALYWWSVIINPLLQVLAFFILIWAVKPLFTLQYASLSAYLFPFQPLITFQYFAVARPDHHGITLLFFLLLLGCTIRLLSNHYDRKLGLLTGIIAAIALWISLESIVIVLISLMFVSLKWIWKREDYGLRLLQVSLALTLTSLLTMLIDDPLSEFFTAETDRRSVLHLAMWASLTVFWLLEEFIYKRFKTLTDRVEKRAIFIFSGTLIFILALGYIYPRALKGPMADIHPIVKSAYWINELELKPLVVIGDTTIVYALGITLISLLFSLYICWRKKGNQRFIWICITILLIVYVALALYQRRWTAYAETIGLIPLTQLAIYFLKRENSITKRFLQSLAKSFTLFVICITPILLYFLLVFGFKIYPQTHLITIKPPSVSKLCYYLNDAKVFGNRPLRILANIYLGPEILYRTRHQVIGTPAHRNTGGIIDTYKIEISKDDENARKIISKRQIDLIILGPTEYLITPNPREGDHLTFSERLKRDMIPSWLQPLPVPDSISGYIRIFKVLSYNHPTGEPVG